MEERFGIPYARTGQPYGVRATEDWLLGVARPLGMEDAAKEWIRRETAAVDSDIETLRQFFGGRTAMVEITEFPGPIRALSLARMAEEFGAHPVVINLHPYTVKERMPSIKFLLTQGQNPDVILTKGLFSLGAFRSSWQTESELEAIARQYDNAVYLGSPLRQPGVPQINLSTQTGYPHYGFAGVKNLARMARISMENSGRPRSTLFRKVLYGDN
jgi:nitrogenase molybdenum-iron protein alpha/beta subunit